MLLSKNCSHGPEIPPFRWPHKYHLENRGVDNIKWCFLLFLELPPTKKKQVCDVLSYVQVKSGEVMRALILFVKSVAVCHR